MLKLFNGLHEDYPCVGEICEYVVKDLGYCSLIETCIIAFCLDITFCHTFYWVNCTGYGKSFCYAYLSSMFDKIDYDALSYVMQCFLINHISTPNAKVIRLFLKDQLHQTTSCESDNCIHS